MGRRLVGTLCGIALALVAAPAHAEKWAGDDATGDAYVRQYYDPADPCYEPPQVTSDAAPGEDITGLVVRHQPRKLVTRIRYAAPATTAERTFMLYVRTARQDLDVFVYQRRDGGRYLVDVFREPQWSLSEIDVDGDGVTDCEHWYGVSIGGECRDAGVELAEQDVTISIPRACLGFPRWVEVGASSGGYVLDEEVSISDQWGTTDSTEPGAVPYGDRVKVSHGQSGAPSNRSRVASSATGTRLSLVRTLTGFPIGTTAATAN